MVISILPFFQDNRSKDIIILIDRPPNTLSPGQNPDVMARRILPLIEELRYSVMKGSEPEDFTLIPPDDQNPKLHFRVIRDDLARGVWYMSGRTDVLFDTLSLSKTDLFQKEGYPVQITKGFHLSYLGFNLKHPILSRIEVRRAIAKALPVSFWIREKYFGLVEPIPDFKFEHDPESSNLALDRVGLPVREEGFRFSLRYLTTPVREGFELALLVREALRRIKIRVEVIPLEPSLFFSKLNRSDFELFGSRIQRGSALTPVLDFFGTQGRRNYFSYSNEGVDQTLQGRPDAGFDELLPRIREDIPILPLFTWNHGVLLSKRVRLSGGAPLNPDDSFRFLSLIRLN
jgi:peptide/nickel transport system substrate-binding protein